jgi:hypothetical protein
MAGRRGTECQSWRQPHRASASRAGMPSWLILTPFALTASAMSRHDARASEPPTHAGQEMDERPDHFSPPPPAAR